MRTPAIAVAALLTLGFDCDEKNGREDLAAARERWSEQGYSDYALTLQHDCFCGQEARGPVVVQKRFGEITRSYVESGEPVPSDFERFFPDVEGLFEFIEEAVEQDAASIHVEFHPELGYPIAVSVDYSESAIDEESGYRVLALEPLRTGE